MHFAVWIMIQWTFGSFSQSSVTPCGLLMNLLWQFIGSSLNVMKSTDGPSQIWMHLSWILHALVLFHSWSLDTTITISYLLHHSLLSKTASPPVSKAKHLLTVFHHSYKNTSPTTYNSSTLTTTLMTHTASLKCMMPPALCFMAHPHPPLLQVPLLGPLAPLWLPYLLLLLPIASHSLG